MAHVLKRPAARADLLEIWLFIADDNEPAADRLADTFEAKFATLSAHPQMGRARPELMPELRGFPVGSYIVFYLPLPDGVDIVRVLHGARDIGVDDFSVEGTA